MKTDSNRLASESVGRLLFSLAVPAITAQLVNMLYNIVDRIFIGRIPDVGSMALTGVGVTFPIILIIAAFSSLIGMGGAPRAAIKMGEHKPDEAEEILGNSVAALISISLALTAFFLIFGQRLLLLFGASPDTLPYSLSYMNIYVCGTLFVQITLGLNSFITTQGFAKTAMLTVAIGAGLNIVLDALFIYGLGLGVSGASAATVISQFFSALWAFRFLTGGRTKLRLKRKYLKISKAVIVPILMLGVSPFIMQSTESLLFISYNASLQKYGGDIAVGSMTILSSMMQMMFLPLTGLTQGAQPIISYNFGARNNDRVRKTFKLLLISALTYSFLFWAVTMTFPRWIVSMFSTDPALIEFGVWSLRIYLATGFVLGAQSACQRTFVALGQAKVSLFLALLRKIILLIPLIYILPNFFSNKVLAVFVAEPIADFLAVSVTVTMFFSQFRSILAENSVGSRAA